MLLLKWDLDESGIQTQKQVRDNLNCQKTEKTLFFIKAPDYWMQYIIIIYITLYIIIRTEPVNIV